MWMPVRRLIGAGYLRSALREARAADHVGAGLLHRVDQLLQLDRVVLAVAVDLRHPLVAVLLGVTGSRPGRRRRCRG